MWTGEKFNEAADPEKQKQPFWTKAILTTASLYYFTGSIMPSMLCYYENVRHEDFAEFSIQPENRIQIPFGYSSFFWDTEPASKRSVERTGNLVFYKGMFWFFPCRRLGWIADSLRCIERNDGGHFAALEHPKGLTQDVRELAVQEWKYK